MKNLNFIVISLTPRGKQKAEESLSTSRESSILSQLLMRGSMSAKEAISSVGLNEYDGRALLVNMAKKKLIKTSTEEGD